MCPKIVFPNALINNNNNNNNIMHKYGLKFSELFMFKQLEIKF